MAEPHESRRHGAEHNITIRLKAARGLYDPEAVREPDVELHPSYADMAVANGCDPGDERLRPCR